MARLADMLIPQEDRRTIAWATGAAVAALLGAALLSGLPWLLTRDAGGYASREVLVFLAVAAFIVTFAATFASVRAGAPAWIWLAPAVVAAWSILKPVLVVAAFGWSGGLARLDITSAWDALAPLVSLALPAARVARLASGKDSSLLPVEGRRFALGTALLALLVFIANGAAAQIADGGFAYVFGQLSDTEALRYFFIANIVVPFIIAFVLTATGITPPAAWPVICIPALAFSLTAVFREGIGGILLHLIFLGPLAIAVFLGCLGGGLIHRPRKNSQSMS